MHWGYEGQYGVQQNWRWSTIWKRTELLKQSVCWLVWVCRVLDVSSAVLLPCAHVHVNCVSAFQHGLVLLRFVRDCMLNKCSTTPLGDMFKKSRTSRQRCAQYPMVPGCGRATGLVFPGSEWWAFFLCFFFVCCFFCFFFFWGGGAGDGELVWGGRC